HGFRKWVPAYRPRDDFHPSQRTVGRTGEMPRAQQTTTLRKAHTKVLAARPLAEFRGHGTGQNVEWRYGHLWVYSDQRRICAELMRLFLGVDGGQSSTKALIGDETGRVLGAGAGGPCNHAGAAGGRGKLARAVQESVAAAREQADLDAHGARFEAACFGMSGGPEDKQAILAEILPDTKLIVTHDALIALSGANAGEPGVVTIAGTGSIAFGRNEADEVARAGGWGFLFGDEGSGFDIVRQAVRASLRFEEGWGPETALHSVLVAEGGARSANDLLHRLYTQEWPRSRTSLL